MTLFLKLTFFINDEIDKNAILLLFHGCSYCGDIIIRVHVHHITANVAMHLEIPLPMQFRIC